MSISQQLARRGRDSAADYENELRVPPEKTRDVYQVRAVLFQWDFPLWTFREPPC
jgi:hypothetical protein